MKVVIVIAALTLAGCASTPTEVALNVKDLCAKSWSQVNVRKGDSLTEATATEIEGNNLAREAVGCAYIKPQSHKATS